MKFATGIPPKRTRQVKMIEKQRMRERRTGHDRSTTEKAAQKSGWTQEQLAAKLNVAKSTISQYENNINEPDLQMLVQMANLFNVSVDYLLGREMYDQAQAGKAEPNIRERLTEEETAYLDESLKLYRKWIAKRKES
ncbi:helix-turn-helix domain-containing protein [Paenibacillus cisolokensis]|nr:helix-turn-helix transcriptional regulator [Paenibacillus cisolokensis]